jgi:hypothetical protein
MSMRRFVAIFATLGAWTAVSAPSIAPVVAFASAATGYRLAGVIAVGPDHLGLLEIPGGKQLLVRQGSVIEGGGRVLMLDATTLRIALPAGVFDLALDGANRLAVTQVAATSVPAKPVGKSHPLPDDQDHLLFRAVDVRLLADTRAARATGPSTDAPGQTAAILGPLMDLPPGARVVAINGQPVTTAGAAIALVERSLGQRVMARLTLAIPGNEPHTYVYVSPAGP